jgi:hypothetical protein
MGFVVFVLHALPSMHLVSTVVSSIKLYLVIEFEFDKGPSRLHAHFARTISTPPRQVARSLPFYILGLPFCLYANSHFPIIQGYRKNVLTHVGRSLTLIVAQKVEI